MKLSQAQAETRGFTSALPHQLLEVELQKGRTMAGRAEEGGKEVEMKGSEKKSPIFLTNDIGKGRRGHPSVSL